MLVGVISDTHDQVGNILKAVKIFNQENIELLIHCGDWVAPFTLKFYQDLKCPIKGVFGNNDGDKYRHLVYSKKIGLDIEYQERHLELDLDGKKIAVTHGDYDAWVNSFLKSGIYDAVFRGHNHRKEITQINKTLLLNPGTLMPVTSDEVKGASIAIYDSSTNSAKLIDL